MPSSKTRRGMWLRLRGRQRVQLLWQSENPRFPQGLGGGARGEGGPLGCLSIALGCWADNAWFPVSLGET